MQRKKTIIIGSASGMMLLMTAGRMNERPMIVPPTVSSVRRLNLSAMTRKISEPRTSRMPWMIGHMSCELAACPVAFSTISGM